MLKIAVLVSGGGTNLQAIIDAIADGTITDTQIVTVISNNAGAYALERANAAGIAASCISPKNYESRALFNEALLEAVQASGADLIVLAGFLVVIPEQMIRAYRNRILSLIHILTQLMLRVGSCDIDDIILNTCGGMLGYGLFFISNRIRRKIDG